MSTTLLVTLLGLIQPPPVPSGFSAYRVADRIANEGLPRGVRGGVAAEETARRQAALGRLAAALRRAATPTPTKLAFQRQKIFPPADEAEAAAQAAATVKAAMEEAAAAEREAAARASAVATTTEAPTRSQLGRSLLASVRSAGPLAVIFPPALLLVAWQRRVAWRRELAEAEGAAGAAKAEAARLGLAAETLTEAATEATMQAATAKERATTLQSRVELRAVEWAAPPVPPLPAQPEPARAVADWQKWTTALQSAAPEAPETTAEEAEVAARAARAEVAAGAVVVAEISEVQGTVAAGVGVAVEGAQLAVAAAARRASEVARAVAAATTPAQVEEAEREVAAAVRGAQAAQAALLEARAAVESTPLIIADAAPPVGASRRPLVPSAAASATEDAPAAVVDAGGGGALQVDEAGAAQQQLLWAATVDEIATAFDARGDYVRVATELARALPTTLVVGRQRQRQRQRQRRPPRGTVGRLRGFAEREAGCAAQQLLAAKRALDPAERQRAREARAAEAARAAQRVRASAPAPAPAPASASASAAAASPLATENERLIGLATRLKGAPEAAAPSARRDDGPLAPLALAPARASLALAELRLWAALLLYRSTAPTAAPAAAPSGNAITARALLRVAWRAARGAAVAGAVVLLLAAARAVLPAAPSRDFVSPLSPLQPRRGPLALPGPGLMPKAPRLFI